MALGGILTTTNGQWTPQLPSPYTPAINLPPVNPYQFGSTPANPPYSGDSGGQQTNYALTGSGGSSGGTGSSGSSVSADDLAYLQDQEDQLRNLLGRTDTGLSQGLTKLDDDYQSEVGNENQQKAQALQDYSDERVDTNKNKLSAYDTINKNAYNGYRSLAQIIGRASGTGSSAFRDLLPDVVGKDTSSKRRVATDTYASNLGNIDKAQKKTEISFDQVLQDLAKQRKQGEEDLRSGIEGQRQDINSKLATVAGQRAQAQGGGYDAVKAAQAPFQSSIDSSKNAVENFFNTFRTAYTPQQAQVATADIGAYNTDRSLVNAQNQGTTSDDPYSQLLRKRLQEGQS